ncbi:hypothetical protein [Acinetobacter haemolyticus]|uniref:hypothetical protein n=1 Tax=Acinetobacter haemolyticus TaxID=29430 RepID=UPI0013733986|nr:hypothetical protein [Acinetobacter haemolyticus]NAR66886.1 hypothetical protein [Acinetobacter haemolyticus]
MCGGNAISSGFEAVGNLTNGLMAEATARGNAKTIKSVANVQSKKIKEQGRKDASSARAAAAENGLDVNVGVPALIEDEILGDAAYNASMNISQAGYGASDVLRQGKMQRNNYGMNAASKAIDTAAQAYGWK